MLESLKKWWKYLGAKLGMSFDERADPKVQLEQALTEAQDQHRRLKEQAANVIATQKQAEMRLNRSMTELERVHANARQALVMADQAATSGDQQRANELTSAAETLATQLVNVERQVEEDKAAVLSATQAADQAKAAVQQNSTLMQQKLAERQKLLSQLEQAKMAEQLNTAMASLNESVGKDVPTFDEVRTKIEARYAKAQGMAELQGSTVEARMLEIEQATRNTEGQAKLAQLRAELGLGAGAAPGEVGPAS